MGLPNPQGGGYRKPLQDMLRAAGIRYEFVGQLTFGAYGKDGVVDPDFSPNHQGLPGFGCLQENGCVGRRRWRERHSRRSRK